MSTVKLMWKIATLNFNQKDHPEWGLIALLLWAIPVYLIGMAIATATFLLIK